MQQKAGTNTFVEKAFRSILCRQASGKEIETLVAFYDETKKELAKDQKKAATLIEPGAYKPKTKQIVDLAAAMQTIQVIYNMQEAITKT